MAQPTREEIIAYITQKAQELGIDPAIAIQIANGESGLNPGIQSTFPRRGGGGAERSYGLYQFNYDGGMGNDFTRDTGLDARDPGTWKQVVDYALTNAARPANSGGQGWKPWSYATNAGIGQYQGLPGGSAASAAQAPAQPSRGRGGQVMPPAQVQSTPGQGQAPGQGNEGLLAELQKMMKPQRTIGSELFKLTGIDKGDATTLGGLAWNTMTGQGKRDAKAQAALAKENPFSAVPTETDKLAKKKVPVPMTAFFEDPNKKTLGQKAWGGLTSLFS